MIIKNNFDEVKKEVKEIYPRITDEEIDDLINKALQKDGIQKVIKKELKNEIKFQKNKVETKRSNISWKMKLWLFRSLALIVIVEAFKNSIRNPFLDNVGFYDRDQ